MSTDGEQRAASPTTPSKSSPATPAHQRGVHLLLLHHGLWGKAACVARLEAFLRQALCDDEPPDAADAAAADAPAEDAAPVAAAPETPAAGGPERHSSSETVRVVNCAANEGSATYDGIDVCGSRVVQVVLEAMQELQAAGTPVRSLSFVGYSLGGLVLRYAVGKLYVLGALEGVHCANFVTIASPHLGSWREPDGMWARFFNSSVARLASRTGRQLMLADADYAVPWLTQQQDRHDQAVHDSHTAAAAQQQPSAASAAASSSHAATTTHQHKQQVPLPPGVSDPAQPVPLLLLMCHPAGPFHHALAGFRTRMLAANIKYDTMVPYGTAALSMTNPYSTAAPVSIDPQRYPSVVRPAGTADAAAADTTDQPQGRTKRLVMFALWSPLVPLLYTYATAQGMLHHRWASRQPLEGASWLQQHPFASSAGSSSSRATSLSALPAPVPASGGGDSGADGEAAAEGTPPAAAAGAAGASKPPEGAASSSEACAGLAAALEHCQQEAQLDTLSRQHSDKQQPGAAAAAAASARVTADGIVEAPLLLHAQQAWMAAQLFDAMPPCVVPGNRSGSGSASSSSAPGGWHRVDVWTGMFHAHAAVVIRDARFEGQSRDVFQYLVDHMSLA